jgi:hypothetical protein
MRRSILLLVASMAFTLGWHAPETFDSVSLSTIASTSSEATYSSASQTYLVTELDRALSRDDCDRSIGIAAGLQVCCCNTINGRCCGYVDFCGGAIPGCWCR